MKALVVGNGGREHALAWKLAQSPQIKHVYVAPGNAGTDQEPNVENVAIDALDFEKLVAFVKQHNIDFTVVGPEAPLVAGIVDYFNAQNLPCLGPIAFAAQLEGSKAFAKTFMQRHGIPTAGAQTFTEINPALDYLSTILFPIVIKADGLAGGKGVVIAPDFETASNALESMLSTKRFGSAGNQVIIEDFIQGEEVSFIVLSDGEHCLPFATSQDHKARDDGDKGPNTGGMGAYSPAPIVTPTLYDKIMNEVIYPTLEGMKKDGHPFKGFLYAGLMITPNNDIKVLEYNCRFGDPETQPILMRLQSDFASLCLAALKGQLSSIEATWDTQPALGVVLAAKGYPDSYETNELISTLHNVSTDASHKIFHAGTKLSEGNIVTNGGRVLCVTALGDSYQDAQEKAYQLVNKIKWDGIFYRHDIGYRAITQKER